MEQYWRYYYMAMGNEYPLDNYYIERDDCYIAIQTDGRIEKHSIINLHGMIAKTQNGLLKECPKEEVIEALNKSLESLDLPKGINRLTHKL